MEKTLFLIIFLLLFFSFFKGIENIFYPGVRILGMGNAYVALADDINTLMYNPAGLAWFKEKKFALFNSTCKFNPQTLEIFNLIKENITELKNYFSNPTEEIPLSIENVLVQLEDNPSTISFSLSPFVYCTPNWGFGGYHIFNINYMLRRLILPSLTLTGKLNNIFLVSLSKKYTNTTSLGVSLKFILIEEYQDILNAARILDYHYLLNEKKEDILSILKQNTSFSKGFGIDIGILNKYKDIFSIPELNANIGVVIQDLLTGISVKRHSLAIYSEEEGLHFLMPNLKVGVAVLPLMFEENPTEWVLTFDWTNIFERKLSLKEQLHFGAEIKFFKILFLRIGSNAGYTSLGTELNLKFISLNMAIYKDKKPRTSSDYDYIFQGTLLF